MPEIMGAIERLVRVGERAGVAATDMIRLLSAGVSVEVLLSLIERNLPASRQKIPSSH